METTGNRPDTRRSLLNEAAKLKISRVTIHAFLFLLMYGIGAALVLNKITHFTALLIWPVMGLILYGFLNAAHDCVHYTHLSTKGGNRIMGVVWCTPIFVNYSIYRYQHLKHHQHTGLEGDTETHTVYLSIGAYLYALSGVSFWYHAAMRLGQTWKGHFPATIDTDERKREAMTDGRVLFAWIIIALTMTLLFPLQMLLVYWMPLLFYPPAAFFMSLPEHYALSGSDNVAKTRSIVSNSFIRFILWNANFHSEHHGFPYIPALNLEALYSSGLTPESLHETSYLNFHRNILKQIVSQKRQGLQSSN